jgi:AcrR family transcriptional regulator
MKASRKIRSNRPDPAPPGTRRDTVDPQMRDEPAPMPHPDRRKQKGRVSRERILEAAIQLFSERGYAGTGVHEIARRAGIEKAALYWHFGSKEGLLAALLERVAKEWVEEIEQHASGAGTPIEQLDRALARLRNLIESRPRHLRLVLSVLLELGETDPRMREAVGSIYEQLSASVTQTLQTAIGRPLPDLDLVAHAVLSLEQSAALRYLADPEHVDLDRFFAFTRRVVILLVADRLREAGLVPPAPSGA